MTSDAGGVDRPPDPSLGLVERSGVAVADRDGHLEVALVAVDVDQCSGLAGQESRGRDERIGEVSGLDVDRDAEDVGGGAIGDAGRGGCGSSSRLVAMSIRAYLLRDGAPAPGPC